MPTHNVLFFHTRSSQHLLCAQKHRHDPEGLGGLIHPLFFRRLNTSNTTAVVYAEQQGKCSIPLCAQLPEGKQSLQEEPPLHPCLQQTPSSAGNVQQPAPRAEERPRPCPHHRCAAPALTSGVMDPQSWLMRVSWCCSVFPCMMGLRVHISAMMQPAPQRSMGGP